MPKRTQESSDEEEEDSGDEQEIQASQKRQKLNPTSSDVGIIEKIELENFMCHKRLEISFGTNINFIVGVNGSMFITNAHTIIITIYAPHYRVTICYTIIKFHIFKFKFIYPRKGGKSAVLIGLAICLGAKAGFTSRASKLSDLIKTGSKYVNFTLILVI